MRNLKLCLSAIFLVVVQLLPGCSEPAPTPPQAPQAPPNTSGGAPGKEQQVCQGGYIKAWDYEQDTRDPQKYYFTNKAVLDIATKEELPLDKSGQDSIEVLIPESVGEVQAPILSPDKGKVVFTTLKPSGVENIYVMNLEDRRVINITKNDVDANPRRSIHYHYLNWSPDAQQILFERSFREESGDLFTLGVTQTLGLYTIAADGSATTPIALVEEDVLADTSTSRTFVEPKWSPDGRRIAYVTILYPAQAPEQPMTVFVVNPDGSNSVKLLSDSVIRRLEWSPSSQRIAFEGRLKSNDGIFAVNVDDQESTALTEDFASAYRHVWSPDGNCIAFIGDKEGKNHPSLYIRKVDGGSTTAKLVSSRLGEVNVQSWGREVSTIKCEA